jgi:hypothetical protein
MKVPKTSVIQLQMFQFVDMDELVPKKHILRHLNEALDFLSSMIGLRRRIRNVPAARRLTLSEGFDLCCFRICSTTPNGNGINSCPCTRAICGFADWIVNTKPFI